MTALARIPVRRLEEVLSDIDSAQRCFNQSWVGPHELSCLDRLDALQDEARAMIEAATGASWSAISGASL